MHLATDASNPLAEFSDWNRYALPASFRGCVDHTPCLLATETPGHDWQAHIEQLVQTPFSDMVLSRLTSAESSLDSLLQQLRQRAPGLTPWLETALQPEPEPLVRLAERHPQCGIQLRLQLGNRDCAQLGRQLQALIDIVEALRERGTPLCLVLHDAPAASLAQLHACMAFARFFGIARVTLCDQQARLTPLGVRNLLVHLLQHYPDLHEHGPALAFKGNDRRGFAVANSMAAIASGIHFVHGSLLAGSAQESPLALQQLLRNYATAQSQQVSCYAKLIGQLTGRPPHADSAPCTHELASAVQGHEAFSTLAPQNQLRPRFIFKVSADDWHVRLLIQLGERQLDLGERVHHYVLLLLAREFAHQQECLRHKGSGCADPLSLGWIERERLYKMIGDSEAQLNVKLCRATKQIGGMLASAGIAGYKPILTRVGSIRFACPDFSIFKDSSLECEVQDWARSAVHSIP